MSTTIEKHLSVSQFPNLDVKLTTTILVIASIKYNKVTLLFKKYKLSYEQYNVLRILRGSHPNTLRIKEISMRMMEKNSNVPRLVDKLGKSDLIFRENSDIDKRESYVGITEKGLQLMKSIDEPFLETMKLRVKMSDEELISTIKTLEKFLP